MSRIDPLSRFVPSLLDRLTDPVADTADADRRRGYNLAQMLDAVRRDMEDLLNCRRSVGDLDRAALPRVFQSVYGYGLPELVSLSAVTTAQRDEIARQIAEVIARYEPRLFDVRVQLLDPTASDHRALRCRIEGRFAMDPSPEVQFDSMLEVMTGHHTVVRKDT